MSKYLKQFLDDIKSNIWYSAVIALLLCWFTAYSYLGKKFLPDTGVQKNAGYNGPIPHSGYGVRFYHK